MIRLTDVKKTYGDFQLDCSLKVSDGKVVGIVGRNSSGKSTVFRAILGLISIDSGDIEVYMGEEYQNSLDKKADIGVAFADSGFSSYMTVKDIAKVLNVMYKKFNKDSFIERCRIADLPLNKKLRDFTYVMLAKLKIIIATSYDAKILLLDEPIMGVDQLTRDIIINLLKNYVGDSDNSILIGSRDAKDLEKICDEIYLLDEGRIILFEEIINIHDQYALVEIDIDEFDKVDKAFILEMRRMEDKMECLVKNKKFYEDKYPDFEIHNVNLEQIVEFMTGGR